MSSLANNGNFLRTSRNFPSDIQALTVELNKAYVDIASQVNNRTCGNFGPSAIVTGENWFLSGPASRQQTLRQVFSFTSTGNIPHGINWTTVSFISPESSGSFTDGTNQYGVLFASNTTIAGQVSFYVTSTNIVVAAGAGAPTISSGRIILEWISQI